MKNSTALTFAALAANLLVECATAANVADNINVKGSTPVTFTAHGSRIAANLYLPTNFKEGQKYPAVVVAHPWGGVKEQTAGLYAQQLAAQGFVTLAYDASHYGQSEGLPRDFEDPADRIDDIRSAVSFLINRPEVNPNEIGALGICAGGGYTLHEAQDDPRVKVVATVSAYDIGSASREGITGSPVTEADRKALMQSVSEELNRIAAGQAPAVYDLLPAKETWTEKTDAFTREAYSYYKEPRGAHPNARNKFVFASLGLHQAYYPFDHLEKIAPRPVLLVAGDKAETFKFSQDALKKSPSNAELYVIHGATHFALYDKPQYVQPIVNKITVFFNDAFDAQAR